MDGERHVVEREHLFGMRALSQDELLQRTSVFATKPIPLHEMHGRDRGLGVARTHV
jgi:hypothetical protein